MMTTMSILLLAVLVAMSVTIEAKSLSLQKEYNLNLKRSFEFKCSKPQPRAIPLVKILKDVDSGAIYSPTMVVLHRCEDSGCCQTGYSCGPDVTEDVKLVVRVEKMGDHGSVKKNLLSVEASDHISCMCTEIGSTPK